MSGLTAPLAAAEPPIAVRARDQAPSRAPLDINTASDAGFFRGLAVAAALVVPFWCAFAYLLVKLFSPG